MTFKQHYISILTFILFLFSCKKKMESNPPNISQEEIVATVIDTPKIKEEKKAPPKPKLKVFQNEADTTFIRLADYSKDFAYDLRYATDNNFLKEQVYDCPECYTRAITAKALLKANKAFMEKGVRIKFFDCYRPNSVQHKMWKIKPNPQYVANPYKGSVHNKGGAVDITLEDLEGNELDMGTDFDFFGWKAYQDNYDLPKKVLENRKLLKETMEKFGFDAIRSEWWHYNLRAAYRYKVADFKWECPTD